jgi:hypothetical protein
MSRRSRRREEDAGRAAGAGPDGAAEERPKPDTGGKPEPQPGGPLTSLGAQLVLLATVFALAVLAAELFGAANLGVAFGVGQIAFAITVVYLMLRR